VLTNAGLVATPSPGSIIALMAMAPKGGQLPVLAGVIVGTVVSFLVAAVIIKRSPNSEESSDDLVEAQVKMKQMKAESKGQNVSEVKSVVKSDVKLIIFACDAGMGSSAMGETILRKALKDAGINDITVKHSPVDSVPAGADVVFTQENLYERAKKSAPDSEIITVKNFLDRSRYEQFINELKK